MDLTMKQIKMFFQERSLEGIKPGLKRMKQLLSFVDNPEKDVEFIHVTGTNGKGSTVQYIKQGLLANQINVGAFISPSIAGLRGHIWKDNEYISEEEFTSLFQEIYPKIVQMDKEGNQPTEFEILTTIAFMYFKKYVKLAIIETGMGAKGDTTNVIEPLISIITNISVDHTNFLGQSIEEISKEKSGIIKTNKPVITGVTDDRSLSILNEKARLKSAPIIRSEEHFIIQNIQIHKEDLFYELNYQEQTYPVQLDAKGIYQINNSALAIVSLVELQRQGFPISIQTVLEHIRTVNIKGRFDIIRQNPLVIVDGAHNVAGIQAFLKTVNHRYNNEHKTLIFSAFKDKQIEEMLTILLPHFDEVILTSFHHPRAATKEMLCSMIEVENRRVNFQTIKKIIKNIQDNHKQTTYFCTGSLFFIKIIQNYLK